MDGTALYEAVAAIYIAQTQQQELSVGGVILVRCIPSLLPLIWQLLCDPELTVTIVHTVAYRPHLTDPVILTKSTMKEIKVD